MNGLRLEQLAAPVLALLLAPLLSGIINRIKAFFAGRRGPPLLQLYWDLFKLLGKGAVYSRTTTWVFRAGPTVGLAAMLGALLVTPLGPAKALVEFPGDLIFYAYMLGLLRFFVIVAALDTGSAFEGMGASREAWLAVLAEPVLLLGLAALASVAGEYSLSGLFAKMDLSAWRNQGPILALVACAWMVIYLVENCRIPVDDPNTHLELTMIHEVMVLDHSGPDLAFILYSAALKLWILGALLVNLFPWQALARFFYQQALRVPGVDTGLSSLGWQRSGPLAGLFWAVVGLCLLAVLVGIIESTMARLRLVRLPQLLAGAGVLSALALILGLRGA